MIIYDPLETVSVEEFLPELRLEFPLLPDDAIANYVRNAISKFCEHSRALIRYADINVYQGVDNYILDTPDSVRVISILKATLFIKHGTKPINITKECIINHDGELMFYSRHDGNVSITMAVTPDRDQCEYPIALLNKYYDTIVLGARADIMGLSGKAWTNLSYSVALKQQFMKECGAIGCNRLLQGVNGARKLRARAII